jgi:Carboxypeptidase regulatory-like domain
MSFKSGKSSYSPFPAIVAVSLTTLDLIAPRTTILFSRLRPHAVLAWAPLLVCLITVTALAQQQPTGSGINGGAMPAEPRPQSSTQKSTEQTPSAESAASVSGVVMDISGAVVPGATVSLTNVDRTKRQTVLSRAAGEFAFTNLPPGSYLLIVDAKGLEPFTSTTFALTAQQAYELPGILLGPANKATTTVVVHTTDVIAAEQIKAEEKQRLLGIVPNFYITYLPNAAPLTPKQKFSLAARDTFDPFSLIGVGIAAGIQQANNSYAGYGQGAAGYGKRFAAQFGNGRSSDFLSHAVFPSLFHQDPRYFYQGTGTFKSRFVHAISYAVIARSDSGRPMPNYSYFLGDIVSGALSNLYYPHANRGVGLVFTNAAIGIAGRAGGTILREFFSKRITTNVPSGGGNP